MKKILSFLFSFVFFVGSVFSQNPTIDEKAIAGMSWDELQAYQKTLKVQQNNQKFDVPSASKLQEYASVGKALGQAFKECWSTVSNDAEKFAQSDAGKWTAFLITWKVMGHDAIDLVKTTVRWFVGIILITAVTPFFMFTIWRNCITKKVLVSKERTSFWNVKKTYSDEPLSPDHVDWIAAYGVIYFAFIGLCSVIMFV